ncbi:hypothetical protein GJAV_G00113970 [Gymnothorax javanicus]|nr:hypothetical protein GJAV_G00113970 [Gymnothorax javanicus]
MAHYSLLVLLLLLLKITQMSTEGSKVYSTGDSYIRRGEKRARETTGTNLGLDAQVQWFGWGGMVWGNLLPFIHQCLRGRAVPEVLLIHCGGNDLGKIKSVKLVAGIKQDLEILHRQFLWMKIMFSAITQRCRWRSSHPKIDKAWQYVNSVMATFVLSIVGDILHHPQIKHRDPGQCLHDGVHFTPIGNYIFLNNIVAVSERPNPGG